MRGTTLTSFLDVLSCALGAAILLAVLFSLVKNPPSTPQFGNYLLGEIEVTGQGRIGLFVQPPKGPAFKLFAEQPSKAIPPGVAKSARFMESLGEFRSTATQKQSYFFVITDPSEGNWEIQPYGMDLIAGSDGQFRYEELKIVKMVAWSRDTRATAPAGSTMVIPTDFAVDDSRAACRLRVHL